MSLTFRHGIHPEEHKEQTEGLAIERMPFVERYVLPLGQHTGAPSKPLVRPGDAVRRGQRIADPGGFVSVALHSPVTGRVTAIGPRRHPNGQMVESVEIEADPFSDQAFEERPPLDPRTLPLKEFVAHVQGAGLVGLGGAAFPSHVKYQLPAGKKCRRVVVNGSECEPWLTCDLRVMVERPQEVLRGTEMLVDVLGAEGATIAVELNKPEALRVLAHAPVRIQVQPVEVKYPQGAEKMLIHSLFGEEIPAGGLPLDLGYVVNNVGTVAALARYFDTGQPLMERVVTVAGPGVTYPANLLVPLGTPIRAVLDHCGGLKCGTRQVIMGGPMMGTPIADLDAPVVKGTSGILAFTEAEIRHPRQFNCLKCGRCLEACPNFLNPSRLARLSRAGRYDEAKASHLLDCFECGACTWSCPSGIPLVQLIRAAKFELRRRQ